MISVSYLDDLSLFSDREGEEHATCVASSSSVLFEEGGPVGVGRDGAAEAGWGEVGGAQRMAAVVGGRIDEGSPAEGTTLAGNSVSTASTPKRLCIDDDAETLTSKSDSVLQFRMQTVNGKGDD